MKLRMLVLGAGMLAMLASPAFGTVRQYSGETDNTIYTLTEPAGVTLVTGWNTCAKTIITIDDNASVDPSLPILKEHVACTTLERVFLTSSTTGVPGSTATVRSQANALLAAGDVVGSRSGNTINWGAITATIIPGETHGQYCNETAPGGCASAGLAVDAWGPSIPPVSPVDSGPWVFADAALSSYTVPTVYRYFDLNPLLGVNIYGEYSNGYGNSGAALPVLAPLGALALSGSLLFMGARVMRKK